MPTVQVDLQEGFTDDRVVVDIGATRFDREAVSTRLMLGLAESVSCDMPAGPTTVHVDLPARGSSETFEITVTSDTFVGVSLVGDQLVPIVSTNRFVYL